MDTLILAETIFYFVVSFALICLGIVFSIIGYYLIHTAKNIKRASQELKEGSEEVKMRIIEVADRLSQLPFLSFFLKSKNKEIINNSKKHDKQ